MNLTSTEDNREESHLKYLGYWELKYPQELTTSFIDEFAEQQLVPDESNTAKQSKIDSFCGFYAPELYRKGVDKNVVVFKRKVGKSEGIVCWLEFKESLVLKADCCHILTMPNIFSSACGDKFRNFFALLTTNNYSKLAQHHKEPDGNIFNCHFFESSHSAHAKSIVDKVTDEIKRKKLETTAQNILTNNKPHFDQNDNSQSQNKDSKSSSNATEMVQNNMMHDKPKTSISIDQLNHICKEISSVPSRETNLRLFHFISHHCPNYTPHISSKVHEACCRDLAEMNEVMLSNLFQLFSTLPTNISSSNHPNFSHSLPTSATACTNFNLNPPSSTPTPTDTRQTSAKTSLLHTTTGNKKTLINCSSCPTITTMQESNFFPPKGQSNVPLNKTLQPCQQPSRPPLPPRTSENLTSFDTSMSPTSIDPRHRPTNPFIQHSSSAQINYIRRDNSNNYVMHNSAHSNMRFNNNLRFNSIINIRYNNSNNNNNNRIRCNNNNINNDVRCNNNYGNNTRPRNYQQYTRSPPRQPRPPQSSSWGFLNKYLSSNLNDLAMVGQEGMRRAWQQSYQATERIINLTNIRITAPTSNPASDGSTMDSRSDSNWYRDSYTTANRRNRHKSSSSYGGFGKSFTDNEEKFKNPGFRNRSNSCSFEKRPPVLEGDYEELQGENTEEEWTKVFNNYKFTTTSSQLITSNTASNHSTPLHTNLPTHSPSMPTIDSISKNPFENVNLEKEEYSWQEITQLIRRGVPRSKRGMVWVYLMEKRSSSLKSSSPSSPSLASISPSSPQQSPSLSSSSSSRTYGELIRKWSPHQHAILIDLGRTFPCHPLFSKHLGSGQLSLYNVLKAYSIDDTAVGYCQGVSFVVGVLLMHVPEEVSFKLLRFLMKNLHLRLQYLPDMIHLQMKLHQLDCVLRDTHPSLYKHLHSLDIASSLYATPWFLTAFACHFPLPFVARLFDVMFLEDSDVIIKMAILLLSTHKELIMTCSSFEECVDFLKVQLPEMSLLQSEKLLSQIWQCDIGEQLRRYEKEYLDSLKKDASTSKCIPNDGTAVQ